jgi:hypothetical protein
VLQADVDVVIVRGGHSGGLLQESLSAIAVNGLRCWATNAARLIRGHRREGNWCPSSGHAALTHSSD